MYIYITFKYFIVVYVLLCTHTDCGVLSCMKSLHTHRHPFHPPSVAVVSDELWVGGSQPLIGPVNLSAQVELRSVWIVGRLKGEELWSFCVSDH